MSHATDDLDRASRPTWIAFVGWALLGVVAGFSAVSFPPGLLVPIVVGAVAARVRPASQRSWSGILTGVGAVSLFVAYLQRRGPGTVCWQTASEAGCEEYLDPFPWLVAGIALAVAGLGLHIRAVLSAGTR
jgi:hypothetical protein